MSSLTASYCARTCPLSIMPVLDTGISGATCERLVEMAKIIRNQRVGDCRIKSGNDEDISFRRSE
jgi:hypothetical protein